MAYNFPFAVHGTPTDGQVIIWNAAENRAEWGDAAGGGDTQIFDGAGSDEIEIPTTATLMIVLMQGAGAGAGSGATAGPTDMVSGGGAGSPGAWFHNVFNVAGLLAVGAETLIIDIGAGGEGGEGAESFEEEGNDGSPGGNTTLTINGGSMMSPIVIATALGGNPGSAGQIGSDADPADGPLGLTSNIGQFILGPLGFGAGTNTAGESPFGGAPYSSGGGSGGGGNVLSVRTAGGNGGISQALDATTQTTGGAAGGDDGGAGQHGTDVGAQIPGMPGLGGAGGGCGLINGGAGGNGGRGAGGGGSGAAQGVSASTTPPGGNGGDGWAIITFI